jgi:hypothetical protein
MFRFFTLLISIEFFNLENPRNQNMLMMPLLMVNVDDEMDQDYSQDDDSRF